MVLAIGIVGISGKMGQALCELISKDKNLELIGGIRKTSDCHDKKIKSCIFSLVNKADVIIDFSSKEVLENILEAAKKYSKPLIIGTTGYASKQLKQIERYSKKIPILYSSNFSLGIAILKTLIKLADEKSEDNFNIKIIESHHKNKKDKPSGTAIMLANHLKNKVSIRSYRRGNIVGKHKISFLSEEEKFEISHEAFSRNVFAKGALKCAKFIYRKEPKLYSIEDIFIC